MTPSPSEEELFRAIADEPDCDEPRIEYAQWCQQERGQEGHHLAKLIRLQLALHKLTPDQQGAKLLAAETEMLLASCRRWWEEPLRAKGWTVDGVSRGLPSAVTSQRLGDVRPTPWLSGVERMDIRPHPRLTAVVTELCHSEWSNGVHELTLPEGTDPLAVVSVALAAHFANLKYLRLPATSQAVFVTALSKSRASNAAVSRLPPLPHLCTVNDTPVVTLLKQV